jgi:hypothetical protein
MLALLLKKNRKEIRNEFRLRFLNIFLVILILIISVNFVFLVAFYFMIDEVGKFSVKELNNLSSEIDQELVFEINLLEDKISQDIKNFSQPNTVYSQILESINEHLVNENSATSSAVTINELSLVEGSKNITAILNGRSQNRESLVDFVDSLRSDSNFENINLPISDLAKDSNLNFTIDFNVRKSSFNEYNYD